LSTTNLAFRDMTSNPGCRSWKPATNILYQLHYNQSNYGSVKATILLLLFRCYCHNMFRSYDHNHVAYSSILSQAVCLTEVGVNWISNHELWLPRWSGIMVTVVCFLLQSLFHKSDTIYVAIMKATRFCKCICEDLNLGKMKQIFSNKVDEC
jgi:hypothetical protein